ncbi:carboxypeptidase-like regulatory domain-containing protein [Algoriphagus resistens]|uniref:carboxypeptidase-like regulatory domain-containing protein n=1 Tax=Algoriphagus resistens TaxID=1750590 RepID=UPI0012FB76B2|nr:carboxypeptidase-like regulatory domain-containing protein [Algoriphagus resistens]
MDKPTATPIVRGQIINKDASPIIGATVIVEGTTTGTVSDANGFFELDLSLFTKKGVTLMLHYIGKETKSVDLKIIDLPKSLGQIKLKDALLK